MRYRVVDLETGIQEALGRKGCYLINDIVAMGVAYQGKAQSKYYTSTDFNEALQFLDNTDIIVGHNIKFDLLYLWKLPKLQEWLSRGGRIWDTQLAEYMLSGQQHKYPALRDIAVNKYGCKEREKRMEKYWDDKTIKVLDWRTKALIKDFPYGTDRFTVAEWADENFKGSIDIVYGAIDTKDIPKDLVLEDVENDVLDTEKVMLAQVGTAKKHEMYDLVMEQMEGLLATTEMEYNGLSIDNDEFKSNKNSIIDDLEAAYIKLKVISGEYYK